MKFNASKDNSFSNLVYIAGAAVAAADHDDDDEHCVYVREYVMGDINFSLLYRPCENTIF